MVSKLWRVVDDRHWVVASLCSEEVAKEIAEAHNKSDPIQTWQDWLNAKAS